MAGQAVGQLDFRVVPGHACRAVDAGAPPKAIGSGSEGDEVVAINTCRHAMLGQEGMGDGEASTVAHTGIGITGEAASLARGDASIAGTPRSCGPAPPRRSGH